MTSGRSSRRFPTLPTIAQRRRAADELADVPEVDAGSARRAMHMAVTLGAINQTIGELGYVADAETAERVARIRAHLDALRDVR
jgi:hypothetical protein